MDAKELFELAEEINRPTTNPVFLKKIIEAAETLQKYEQAATKIMCAYCGEQHDRNEQAIYDHIFTCEKRPEKKLLEKAFEVEDRLYGFIKHLIRLGRPEYFHTDCETCKEIFEAMKIYDSEE